MMKRNLFSLTIIAFFFLLSSSFLPRFVYKGISPDLPLLYIVSYAFLNGKSKGAWIGFCAGLLQDIATGTFLGLNTLSKLIIGFLFGSFSNQVFKEQKLLPFVSVAIASVFNYFFCAWIVYLLGYEINLLLHMREYFGEIILMNVAFSYVMNLFVKKMDVFFNEKK